MNILLTGGAGFVGSHCVEYWLRLLPRARISVLDSLSHKGRRERLEHIDHGGRLTVFQVDLAERQPYFGRWDWVGNLPDHDIIINMASDSHVDRSITCPATTWLNNTSLIINMLQLACRIKPSLFVQVSTDEVYGPARAGQLHPEWDPIIPSNPYSASKAAQEALCIAYWRTFDVPVVIVNLMNMIGERQDAEKFLPKVIGQVLRGEEVQIHGDPVTGAIGSRFYLHADNCADALAFLMNRPASRFPGVDRPDRFNLAGDEEISNLTLAQMVADILERPLRYRVIDWARPGHDLRYGLDGTKLAGTGWRPSVPLRQAIERTVRWYAEHPHWLESTDG